MGLTVSEEKTKITNSYKEKIYFLGTYIRHALVHTYSLHKYKYLQRNARGLLLTCPMSKIKRLFTEKGYLQNNLPRTRIT